MLRLAGVLVTGASGFLGGKTVLALSKHHEVVSFSNEVPKDVDVVFHFAGKTSGCELDPEEAVFSNAMMTMGLLECIRKSGRKPLFVFASTGGVGEQGFYALSKRLGESLVEHYSQFFPCVTLRLFFPYGKGENPNRLVSRLFSQVKSGKSLVLDELVLNPIHYSDVVVLAGLIVEKRALFSGYSVFDVAGVQAVGLSALAEDIMRVCNKFVSVRKTGRLKVLVGNPSGLRGKLGFVPKKRLLAGLGEYVG